MMGLDTNTPQQIRYVDSHTAGEPTRVVLGGVPDLGGGSVAEQRAVFREQYDDYRATIINEPRGFDAVVGALLCKPVDPNAATGVIFFNNTGYLNMCGHGMIGLGVTLRHLGRIRPGIHQVETPVGTVFMRVDDGNHVTIENVPSYRHAQDVSLNVDGFGVVTGDIAWGGNWFFLVSGHDQPLTLSNLDELTRMTLSIRKGLERDGITGADGGEIDHIELLGPSENPAADSRNFVLCPGGAYDRSPCCTGTSAKMACLVADGTLREGETWRQESITGQVFEGSVRIENDLIIPSIMGSAYVTNEGVLLVDPNDPFAHGIRG
jgi:4-hydroxyproline epimerase